MNTYESSWRLGWQADTDDFEGFGSREPELNVIEFLDSLDDVERITSASLEGQNIKSHNHSNRDPTFDSYAFNCAAYELTIKCIESGSKPTEKQIRRADPLFPQKKRSNRTASDGLVTRWRSFASNLAVVEVEIDGIKRKGLNSKWDKSNRIIAYREEWPLIVDKYHIDAVTGTCFNFRTTLQNMGQYFVTGSKRHGISEEYIRSRISLCSKCAGQLDELQQSGKRLKKNIPDRWPEVHTISWQQLDNFIESFCIRHRVSLRKESTYRIASPEPSIVTTWVCARGYRKQDTESSNIRCSFRIRTVIPVRIACLPELNNGFVEPEVNLPGTNHAEDTGNSLMDSESTGNGHEDTLMDSDNQKGFFGDFNESFFEQPQQHEQYIDNSTLPVTVLLNRTHKGHNPNDKEDYINFPVHVSAKEAVFYEFDLTWDIISVSRASLRMDMLLKSKASDLDKATCRFHLIPKEVAQLSTELNSQGRIASNDWCRLLKEVDAHKKNGNILFLQQYDVFNLDEEKQPFVCVIMTSFMEEMAERFSADNVWAIDSTFKTCVRGLPLYAAVVPNQDGVGMPVFFMICSADTGSRHESIALRLALRAVFKQINVRPAAILMNKSRLMYDALSDVISRDEKCWRDGKQIACRLLLCWLCVKKSWVEDLLPQVAPDKRRDVYRRLDAMMMASSETDFNNLWTKLREHYGDIKEIISYLEMGWVGTQCAWRQTWPKYTRTFEHHSVETINIVRHFWLFINYTLFSGRINQSNSDLLIALVGSATSNFKLAGGTLEGFFRQRQAFCDSRRYHNQASTSAERKRLAAADRYLAQYNEDKTCFEVLSEPGFLFRLHNCGGKTHVVNLLTNFCDCLEMTFTCEHLLAARLLLKHNFVGMYGLLERRVKEGDEPLTQVEDIDLAWLDEREASDDRAFGLTTELQPASVSQGTEWDALVQEVAHVQMQLSNLQACCEDQLIGSSVADELLTVLNSQLKSLRAFSSGTEQDTTGKTGTIGDTQVGVIQEHIKACKLQAVRSPVQLKLCSGTSSNKASYAHAQTVVHPKVGYVHYYKQLRPGKVDKRKCVFCGVYNIVGGALEVTECKNCSRYLFYEVSPLPPPVLRR